MAEPEVERAFCESSTFMDEVRFFRPVLGGFFAAALFAASLLLRLVSAVWTASLHL
jgi:hypothetical protein